MLNIFFKFKITVEMFNCNRLQQDNSKVLEQNLRDYKMIIRLEQTFIGTTEVSLLSSSSDTIINDNIKHFYIHRDRKAIGVISGT